MATVLTVLVALTAAAAMREGQEGVPSGSHLAVVEEAFACLMSLSETAPESSAQAECVKVALVSLKEWVQVRVWERRGRGERERETTKTTEK